ncbi:MAG: hypothetical protein ACK5MT_11460 [Actinomycetales bacterium]
MPEPRFVHPQPLGIFGVPAGLMLLPDSPAAEQVRRELLAGRLPARWPPELRVQELAYAGDETGALAACPAPPTSSGITSTGTGGTDPEAELSADPIARYHRWLLDPSGDDPTQVRAGLPAQFRPLVDVARAADHTTPMDTDDQGSGEGHPPPRLPAEVAALMLAGQAARLAGRAAPEQAAELLIRAAETAEGSPVLAAVLRGNAGLLRRECGDPAAAGADLATAADALARTDLGLVRAELLLQLGSLAQEAAANVATDSPDLLRTAIQHYYEGLRLVSEDSAATLWATLTMNLATAHLASAMTSASDQLRLGVATQGLRAARRVFASQQDRTAWSTATLNLANALVYTPSTHQGDNLVEAVELYEEVLGSGIRDHDAAGKARVLANQGNALAHLGAFTPATAKLVEARYLFETEGDDESVLTVRGILDEIAKTQVRESDPTQAELARQVEQLARMPVSDAGHRSGMGVHLPDGVLPGPPPTPTVTVLQPGQTHPDVPTRTTT